jgi:hypothetical protein
MRLKLITLFAWALILPVSMSIGFFTGWFVKFIWNSKEWALITFAITFAFCTFGSIWQLDRFAIKHNNRNQKF